MQISTVEECRYIRSWLKSILQISLPVLLFLGILFFLTFNGSYSITFFLRKNTQTLYMHNQLTLFSQHSFIYIFISTPSDIFNFLNTGPPVYCHLFVAGGGGLSTSMTRKLSWLEFLILLLGPPKPDRLKDRGQTK